MDSRPIASRVLLSKYIPHCAGIMLKAHVMLTGNRAVGGPDHFDCPRSPALKDGRDRNGYIKALGLEKTDAFDQNNAQENPNKRY